MNWQVVKDLVAYGREQEKIHDKKFRFTLTTNGVLLNDESHGILQQRDGKRRAEYRRKKRSARLYAPVPQRKGKL